MLLEEEDSLDLWDVLRKIYEAGISKRESMTPENKAAEKLQEEAVQLLCAVAGLPPDVVDNRIKAAVNKIVAAALLRVSAVMRGKE